MRRLGKSCFAHCGERPKGVALWTPTTFEKVDKTFKFEIYFFHRLFRQTESPVLRVIFIYNHVADVPRLLGGGFHSDFQ